MVAVRIISDMPKALRELRLPSVTQWNRIEGRPRTTAFDRSLRAEVRDPLWMLCRQWQLGELRGDDAGSPVLSQLRLDHTRLTRARFGEDPVEDFIDELPLEPRVERLATGFERSGHKIAFDLRLLMGRHWHKLIHLVGGTDLYAQAYRDAYPIAAPDPADPAQVDICAHPGSFATISVVAGRAVDGGDLWRHLTSGGRASDGIAGPDGAALDGFGDRFVAWFARLIEQPAADRGGAWDPSRLEYRFDVSAPRDDSTAKVYTASGYAAGGLDWWAVDVDPARDSLDAGTPEDASVLGSEQRTVIPAPLQYDGMPNPRWWTFEDGRINFGTVTTATTDIAKLLFLEFALVAGDDWLVAPFTAPAGTVSSLVGCTVTTTFGERFWIEPAGKGVDDDPGRFTLFTSSVLGDARQPADTSLLLMPRALHVVDGPVQEEVLLLRDEMANMVWGVEKQITLPDGTSVAGAEAARETRAYLQRIVDDGPAVAAGDPASKADIRYRVMNSVPEHWIPFIAAQDPRSDSQIRLQRASMPRVLDDDPADPLPVKPQTTLLRPGLDVVPATPYFVEEDEVPREGTRVVLQYQRTRWRDGRVVLWRGVRKQVGRGEGTSGLGFDRLESTPEDPVP